MKWTSIVLIVLGIWLLLSPWVLGFSSLNLPAWNNAVFGILIILFTLWNSSISK